MSVKTGFTSINGVVNSTTNMGLAIQFPPLPKRTRIFNIQCGYSLRAGAANTYLMNGRLLIVGMKFDPTAIFISPRAVETSVLGNSQIYFDVPIAAVNGTGAVSESFEWLNGLVLPDGQDATIILTSCFGDGTAIPAAADVNAYLNASGLVDGSDKIFKNV